MRHSFLASLGHMLRQPLGRSGEVPLVPHRFRVMSPREFVRFADTRRDEIKSVKIVTPRLGRYGRSRILVELVRPVYVPEVSSEPAQAKRAPTRATAGSVAGSGDGSIYAAP